MDTSHLSASKRTDVFNVHTDHLGSPRKITNQAGNVIWQWAEKPFGDSPVNQDPDNDGVVFEYNLRFPGQFFDKETGLHYNYHRYYDSQTGRYITSDPIGLRGGLNTYGYVGGNPVRWIDPLGWFTLITGGGGSFAIGGGFDGSGGAYLNPGLFGQDFDVGGFLSGGVGTGYSIGLTSYAGVVFGEATNVNTPFVNTSISTGWGSLTLMFDPNTSELGGLSFGPAAKAGAAVMYTDTGKFGFRNLVDIFKKTFIPPCKQRAHNVTKK